MWLRRLEVVDARIVRWACLDLDARLNVVTGANAAGKTSVLEAIHVLGTGRSFAAGTIQPVVRTGGGPMRIVARVDDSAARQRMLGFERSARGRPRLRLDGQDVARVADLARLLPLVVVHPGSHELIAGGPGERRRFLDRGLFHVEPAFQSVWHKFRRTLDQRNALLRAGRGNAELVSWESAFEEAGSALHAYRSGYVEDLGARVERLGRRLLGEDTSVGVRYSPGWDHRRSLAAVLAESRGRDRELHRTTRGPHCADLRVEIDGRSARQRVSRGQQKILAYVLRLAQAEQLVEGGGCLLLFDDLPAELDAAHRAGVLDTAVGLGAQVILTALEPKELAVPAGASAKWFHVEQGAVSELIQ